MDDERVARHKSMCAQWKNNIGDRALFDYVLDVHVDVTNNAVLALCF